MIYNNYIILSYFFTFLEKNNNFFVKVEEKVEKHKYI